ncbi:MAG: hypothetical protein IPI59_07115 [Sphingobacteriales bacterium]|nr:hypothetical protein [Sphingobacteriales bacterium]MBK7527308.1 hypothetical protein [Sphingobacteriales bacterium]MBK8678345.1 hypothetical protein [Sphingobacteriales bacterium]MBP9141379.1 hypothetical protein [Chitinophagales bacterium]
MFKTQIQFQKKWAVLWNCLLLGGSLLLPFHPVVAQDKAQFSGDLQSNTKFFIADSARGAVNVPFYDYLFFGSENWLNLNCRVQGYEIGARFDFFQNTNIFSPTVAYSGQGIGRWYVSKHIENFSITAGHFYDQYATGHIFRAYEARPLGIDQAILGVNLGYKFNNHLNARASSGVEKNIFTTYRPVLKGGNLEGNWTIKKASIIPGIAYLGRTIDNETMLSIASEINSYPLADRFVPKYNTNAVALYNTLSVGNISWYIEGAYKGEDVIRNTAGRLKNPSNGYVLMSSLSWSRKGLGIVVQGRRNKNFDLRTSPQQTFTKGLINFMPPLARQNAYRLAGRYNAATQPLGEMAFQAEITYSPKRSLIFTFNATNITNPDDTLLFREIYLDATIKPKGKSYKGTIGIQAVDYNQFVFEQKGKFVNTFTPFAEFVYKFTKKQSLKTELSYMFTERNRRLLGKKDAPYEQDKGDWFWVLAEYSIAPAWSFALSDLYNIDPDHNLHYPSIFVSYTRRASRFALSYVKQPAGVVCTGGVCRYEPAFSGVKLDITTSF